MKLLVSWKGALRTVCRDGSHSAGRGLLGSSAWREADNLRVGDEVDTPDNGHITVLATRRYTAAIITYNLTVDDVHTYYILAGRVGVLVHNCGEDGGKYGHLQLAGSGNEINHMPQNASTSRISKYSGPAARMARADHRQLWSTGSSLQSRAWLSMQKSLVDSGRIDEALMNDVKRPKEARSPEVGSSTEKNPNTTGDLVGTVMVAGRFDLTGEQWAALLPAPSRPGRTSSWSKRQLVDEIRWRGARRCAVP
ncbi:polymorphic toxin-type HINT domain-containing protein [Amycolatopsis carbonis]|uniref:Polymorphic toxin-type HINT domain-containing protein n=1 Tax=Amycolatopsis carbonis TaxID=715471 RepID=A0A9Y2IF26_9PSEU|nr:polymorphic toxin-type HINT domain-containing protein [Amycolatopsis sp. 2-15]WIX78749.1 polymorphic toxin-type HINT domain-containing protein [Amycolatopsis sp. 2-15]